MARREKIKRVAEQLELTIESLGHDGRGIARREGKCVFVEGALPGERVQAQVRRRRSRFEEALTLKVLEAAPGRVEPTCAHASICGGCSLQHLDTDLQVELKQSILLEQLQHFGQIQPQRIAAPVRAHPYHYRRKARLGVKYVHKREAVLVGFRESRSNFITDIDTCHTLDQRVGTRITALAQRIGALEAYQSIPQIEVAAGDDQVALVFRHLEPLSSVDVEALITFGQEESFDIYLQPGGHDTVHKIWPEDGDERLSYALTDFDLKMRFHPLDFTQVNADINRQMVRKALEYLAPQPGERVLDLFCGLGNFTLPLARSGAEVVGVEGSEAMVARGQENAQLNGLNNVQFYAADLTQDFRHQVWGQQGFDKILIDPPRSGALEMVQAMAQWRPKRIVYVSCNPATLARDAGELKKLGYALVETGILDMFPQTTHVESIALFVPA